MHIYVISGLGADEKVFCHTYFAQHTVVHLPWLPVITSESLQQYAMRMASTIDTGKPFMLMGLSFGGMVAIEISKVYKPHKIILLSTIKTQYEKPTYMKALQKIPAHKYFPLTWMQKMKTTASFMFGVTSSDEQNLINTYVANIDTAYLKWSIDKIIHWQNETYPGNVIHIHGSSDRIFPIQNIKADFVIKNGGHFMLMNKAAEVNDILRKIL